MDINANIVKELREKTGAGVMDCKKALAEASGDLDKAIVWLRERGIARLVTTTPDFGGRSFGTNVVEAALVAFLGKHLEAVDPAAYSEAIARLNLRPRLVELNAAA